MSPTDAKRGAKRRKNKRGGGSSCSAACNTSAAKAGVASALGCPGTAASAAVVNFLTPGTTGNGNVGGINGEVSEPSRSLKRGEETGARLAAAAKLLRPAQM